MTWEAVIGIETHVELSTRSKMFCACRVDFDAEPNTVTCPVCLGLPGALPVPNRTAVEWAVKLGLALESTIADHSVFHRKNYFYGDLPKNYQISQFDIPFCAGGHLDVEAEGETVRVGITRVHLEEDTGKSTHIGESGRIHAASSTLIDFNRSGVPLVEVVTEPDIRTPAHARAYAEELRRVVLALGISDAKLEEGSLRFDANVSLRPAGETAFGAKVEVKNMNSLRSLHDALAYEIERQAALLDGGGAVQQETRHWDEETGRSEPGRSKEESSDYRYFTEPDLVPIEIGADVLGRLRSEIPELPAARRDRYRAAGVADAAVGVLVEEPSLGALFDEAVAAGAGGGAAAQWLTGEVVAHLRRTGTDPADAPLTGVALAELTAMVDGGDLSATAAKDVLAGVLDGEGSPRQVAEARDLLQVSDEGALAEMVRRVLADHPDEAQRLAGGDEKVAGFLVGQVMRTSGGKADPTVVSRLIADMAGE
jgi:aspartyl-tRNA(Asn)/glutamyl-tRNA(Gln) amidotransferase subunit B